MKLLAHRGLWEIPQEQNSIRALHAALDLHCGIETDLRSFEGQLYLSHDPILDPSQVTKFESLLELAHYYPKLPIFLNIKEDGLLPLIHRYKSKIIELPIVFFDMSVPELIQYAKIFTPGFLATRVSEFETEPVANELCNWVWVDGFTREIDRKDLEILVKKYNKSWAFVSPELHGRKQEHFWDTLQNSSFLPIDGTFLCTDLINEYLRKAA